ncbi:glycoside hydrolase TIM-barrel-like domain-containing protein [Pricia sp. S334]|uniref:Glycoside hydrolase TIM-barrel-like domain-containing protein n=1 Tax=Pricia mediterranea TaxID=3076079 RepID=A0ABU3L673_9FLAO|nr:glycoside hydrolase TIM-barrel-like domain-containing protein [Pricia sp. S334]MDT7829235.1 glycoside hydrolase TIM-barrel-like domain-containing protein [Pricia sp. S334]
MKKFGWFLLCLIPICLLGQSSEKINGISFVASREGVAQEHVAEVIDLNANYAAIMPFGFIRDINSPVIIFNTDRQWFGETKEGAMQYIKLLHDNGIKTMVKPQIWIWKGEFTGRLTMHTEADWKILEDSYEDFIMTYANMAADAGSELFCVGTELARFVQLRPDYWHRLIAKIRTVYSGKLTYAANWDEYDRIPFWEDLDYIGIDAYFPLSEEKTPSVAQLKAGWQEHKDRIKALYSTCEKPVLFTEYGYRSTDQTAWKPWLVDRHEEPVNLTAQENATRAILEEFWPESWFAGGYVWKWFIDHKQSGGERDNRFTPQNKPAEEVLRDFYRRY